MEWRRFVTYLWNDPRIYITAKLKTRGAYCMQVRIISETLR